MTRIRRALWLRRWRLAMFRFTTADRILDIGCGDGLDIALLGDMGMRHTIGVDISSSLLAVAKKRNPGVRFVHANAQRLPFADGYFDIVLADSMLYHLQNYKDLFRVLRPGGRFCFIEMHNSSLRKIYNLFTVSLPFSPKRKRAYLVEKKAIEAWDEYSFREELRKTGFQKIFWKIDGLSVVGMFQKP